MSAENFTQSAIKALRSGNYAQMAKWQWKVILKEQWLTQLQSLIVLGLMSLQHLWVILCRLPEKGRKEIVEEMKERDR